MKNRVSLKVAAPFIEKVTVAFDEAKATNSALTIHLSFDPEAPCVFVWNWKKPEERIINSSARSGTQNKH